MAKILSIVSYTFLPFSSGGQKLIAQFNEFLGQKAELTVIGTADNNVSLVKNYTLLPWMKVGMVKFFDVGIFFRLKKYIQNNKIEYVLIEHPYMGWLGLLLAKSCAKPLAVHTHNIEFERFRSIGKKWWLILKIYEIFVLRSADVVFCISEEDRQYMEERLGLPSQKLHVIPFGLPIQSVPLHKNFHQQTIRRLHNIPEKNAILLFNGVLSYQPNSDALMAILDCINPILLQTNLLYTIVVCGKELPEALQQLQVYTTKNIVYAGFVKDIEQYFKAADVFLNPVITGGGVKTKLIEAIGYNATVVSTQNGAIGCNAMVCLDKLIIVPNGDWSAFAAEIISAIAVQSDTPQAFYDTYYWGNIADKALQYLMSSSD